jgi:hypothetical protein
MKGAHLHPAFASNSKHESRNITPGLVQPGLCGGFAPHESLSLCDRGCFIFGRLLNACGAPFAGPGILQPCNLQGSAGSEPGPSQRKKIAPVFHAISMRF